MTYLLFKLLSGLLLSMRDISQEYLSDYTVLFLQKNAGI